MAHSRLCTLDGCSKPERARGLCGAHYEAARTAGTWSPAPCRTCGGPALARQWYCSNDCQPRCSVEDCADKAHSRGWCMFHYTRWKLHGDAEAAFLREKNDGLPCSFDGCDEPRRKAGLCVSHYSQQQKGIPLRPVAKWRRIGVEFCLIEGCGERPHALDLCSMHYVQQRQFGRTLPLETPCERCGETVDLRVSVGTGRRRSSKLRRCDNCARKRIGITVGQLVERDGDICHLCFEPVDMGRVFPDPGSPSRDHVIPFSLGGSNKPENIKLAHLICNIRRGNRPLVAEAVTHDGVQRGHGLRDGQPCVQGFPNGRSR